MQSNLVRTRDIVRIRKFIRTLALSPYGRKLTLALCDEIEELQTRQRIVQEVVIESLLGNIVQLEIENGKLTEQINEMKP